jgi:hypothetical protein
MNLLQKINEIVSYFRLNRQKGHTTATLNGFFGSAREPLVLFENRQQGNLTKIPPKDIVSLGNLIALRGHNRPLLVDHHVVVLLLEEAGNTIGELNTAVVVQKQLKDAALTRADDKERETFATKRKLARREAALEGLRAYIQNVGTLQVVGDLDDIHTTLAIPWNQSPGGTVRDMVKLLKDINDNPSMSVCLRIFSFG